MLQPNLESALALWREQKLAAAQEECLQLLAQQPTSTDVLNLLAEVHKGRGDLPAAVECLAAAADIQPGDAAARRRVADACLSAGEHAGAIVHYRRAIELEPASARAHNNLGLALAASGDREGAAASYRQALAVDPGHGSACVNLADLRAEGGELSQALEHYRVAISTQPELGRAWTGGARVLLRLNQPEQAVDWCRRALAQGTGTASLLVSLASAQRRLARPDEALCSCALALEQKPEDVEALYLYANLLHETGERERAISTYRQLLDLAPGHLAARMGLLMAHIPVLPQNLSEEAASRLEFEQELHLLVQWLKSGQEIESAQLIGAEQPFFLSYQEEDNRELLSCYGRICCEQMGLWGQRQSPAAGPPLAHRAASGRVRVGIVCAHICEHSVYKALVEGWLKRLPRAQIELVIFSLGGVSDAHTETARHAVERFFAGPRSLRDWTTAIRAERPDVLLYPEVGMHPTALQLASLRLAPVQAAAWGHPETTGLPTVDYYLSAEAFEGPDAARYYSEKLVCLPNLGTYIEPDEPPAMKQDRFVAAGPPVLLCPGTPFKYACRHDGVFVELARRLGDCRFCFFDYHGHVLSTRLLERVAAAFDAAGMDASRHLLLLPWCSPRDFAALMRRADLMLDTIGFSGFNTVMMAVQAGLPIVTRRGRFLRGRFGAGILERLSLGDFVAEDDAGYVEKVVQLVQDAPLRLQHRATMRSRQTALFRDVEPIAALTHFLLRHA
jgi:predicted O-linked N-acetylglucosamine transferase (SPINDLY family)